MTTLIAIIAGVCLACWLETYIERRRRRANRGNNSFVISFVDGRMRVEPTEDEK